MISDDFTELIASSPNTIDYYLDRGIALFDEGRYFEAISDLLYYESSGGLDPTVQRYLALSFYYSRAGSAVSRLERYLQDSPNSLDVVLLLADHYYELCNYFSAAKYYKIAVEKGYDPNILVKKAQPLLDRKMYDEAGYFVDVQKPKKWLFRRR